MLENYVVAQSGSGTKLASVRVSACFLRNGQTFTMDDSWRMLEKVEEL